MMEYNRMKRIIKCLAFLMKDNKKMWKISKKIIYMKKNRITLLNLSIFII
jgi:hypothetical protein